MLVLFAGYSSKSTSTSSLLGIVVAQPNSQRCTRQTSPQPTNMPPHSFLRQIKTEFLPWLFERVGAGADQWACVRDTVDNLLEAVDETAETARTQRVEARHRETEVRHEAARIARERVVRLFVPAELVGGEEGERLGPVAVQAGDAVITVETRVAEWLASEGGGGVEELAVPEGGFLAGYLREARRRGGGRRMGKDSLLLELQESMGAPSDEILLQTTFESPE